LARPVPAPSAEDQAAGYQPIANVDDLRGPGPHAVSTPSGVQLVVLRTGGALKVFQGLCPHQGASLGLGKLVDGKLVCADHNWKFDGTTGKRVGGNGCLKAYAHREDNGQLLVDLGSKPDAVARADAKPYASLPGPRGVPLFGNGFNLELESLHTQFETWEAKHGSPYRFKLGPRHMMAISDPAAIDEALRARPDRFRRPSNLEKVMGDMGTNGVFSAEGAAWWAQRRLAMAALAQRNLRGFYPTLALVAGRLERRWDAAAASGAEVDVQADLMRFTVDVTTSLAFGYDMNTLEQGEDVIQRKLELIFPKLLRRLVALVPYWRMFRLPSDRRLDRALAELREFLTGLIAEAREGAKADPSRAAQPKNFLDAMLAARDEHGQPFSDELLFGNAMTMLLAGEDTTANTLAWAVHELCDAPDEIAALRAELTARGIDGVPPDLEAASGLAYAGAIASETLRVRPVAPFQFVEALHDDVLAGVAIPKGTVIAVLFRSMSHKPEHFAEPDRFRPRRWLEPVGAHEPAAHLPFGSGPRICPGRSLALIELKVVLALLYARFDVERVGAAADVREQFNFTMMPDGLRVRLRRRG
jgi:cytochrome P450/nitrite reductase/ring-hydroxylating ferredoxin subunit